MKPIPNDKVSEGDYIMIYDRSCEYSALGKVVSGRLLCLDSDLIFEQLRGRVDNHMHFFTRYVNSYLLDRQEVIDYILIYEI